MNLDRLRGLEQSDVDQATIVAKLVGRAESRANRLVTELHCANRALALRNIEIRKLKSELRAMRHIWRLVGCASTQVAK